MPANGNPAEGNKTLVRRFYQEIDDGNPDAMDELVTEDYLDHSPPPFPGIGPGREGLKQAFRIFWDATPGRHTRAGQARDTARHPLGESTRQVRVSRSRRGL